MQAAHDSPLAGHPRFLKTYSAIRERFSWQGLKGHVLRHVQEHVVCQKNKVELSHPAGLLQSLPILERKWESVSMDLITRLPTMQVMDCIYIVVNRLTKSAHFFVIPSKSSTSQVAELFFREVFWLHGLPKTIVSDRDS